MENITIFETPDNGTWVQIDRGNGEYTSMPKSVYDEMLASQEAKPTEWVEPQLTK